MKRKLQDLNELRSIIEQLREEQIETRGQWTAAQILYHLASAFEGSLNRLPVGYPLLVRRLVRPFRWMITKYRFPPWLPIPAAIKDRLDPPADVCFEEQQTRLLRAINLFTDHADDHPPHPVLGELNRSEWIGFHLSHSSHHLSFIRRVD